MSARRLLSSRVGFAVLGLAFCLVCWPVEAAAQRGGGGRGGFGGGGHGSFGGGGFRGGASFGGTRMAPPAPTFRPSFSGSRPMTYVARAPQGYRGYRGAPRYSGPRYSRPGGVPRSSYTRSGMRPAGANRFARPGPGSSRSGSRASISGSRPGRGWQRFGGGRHHRFFNSNFWFNPFYNPYSLVPFFWAPYPFYSACTPYYSDYGDDSGAGYTNGNWPAEENEAEAPAEENVAPEPEEMSGEEYRSQLAPAPLEQTVVVEMADGRTKTFTWRGDKMIVTVTPAPSKATPAAPQGPSTSLQP